MIDLDLGDRSTEFAVERQPFALDFEVKDGARRLGLPAAFDFQLATGRPGGREVLEFDHAIVGGQVWPTVAVSGTVRMPGLPAEVPERIGVIGGVRLPVRMRISNSVVESLGAGDRGGCGHCGGSSR